MQYIIENTELARSMTESQQHSLNNMETSTKFNSSSLTQVKISEKDLRIYKVVTLAKDLGKSLVKLNKSPEVTTLEKDAFYIKESCCNEHVVILVLFFLLKKALKVRLSIKH